MQSHARVVVVGGGCVGASIIHGLTRHGCSDVVLLERTQLTAGSTWHAAGLLNTYGRSYNFARMAKETIDIYQAAGEEAGVDVGLHLCGQLRIANTPERMDEFRSFMGIARTCGIDARLLGPSEAVELYPLLNPHPDIVGAIHLPYEGHINPADITQAMAGLARKKGAKIHLNTAATAYERRAAGGWKVTTNQGEITCEHLVFATGNYARENALRVGLEIPAIPIIHQYWTTETVPELVERKAAGLPELPVLRDEDYGGYLREDTGGIQFGPYEFTKDLKLFAEDGVPEWFGADLLPEDFDAVEVQWTRALDRVPVLGSVGIKANTRGPFQMTPDEMPLCGPAPGLRNLWLAEGMPGGILWGGTVGEHLAQWILTGDPGIDMREIDPRRFGGYVSKNWTREKVRETWGMHMHVAVPGEDREAARPAKTTPGYDLLSANGAVWSVMNGWEIPRWFAPSPELAVPEFSYRRTKHMEYVQAEVEAVRTGLGLNDISPMGKFIASGPGTRAWLDGILANSPPAPGRIKLAVHCNAAGGVIGEYTVIGLAEDRFYLVCSPAWETLNGDALARLLPGDGSVRLENISDSLGLLAVSGPKAREVLQEVTDVDLSNDAFPWLSARRGNVGMAPDVTLLRVSFTGELGWELHHPMAWQRHILTELLRAGEPHGLKLFGLEALESMRLDKSYRAIGRDLNAEITALEAGLDRFIVFEGRDFPGREALLRQRDEGVKRRLVTLQLPRRETSVIAHETVFSGDRIVGRVTSGGYSYHLGCDIALALLDADVAAVGTDLTVSADDETVPARVVDESPYDSRNEAPRK